MTPRLKPACAPFAKGLRHLFPVVDRAKIRALFDNQVTWQAIADWRAGKREPPQWAVERLERMLRLHAAPVLETADELASVPPRLGTAWNKHALTLIGWRARQALENEKAGD